MDLKYYTEVQLDNYAKFILNDKHLNEYSNLSFSLKLDYLIAYNNKSKLINLIKTQICLYCNSEMPAGSTVYNRSKKYWCYSHDPNFECPNCRNQTEFKLHHIEGGNGNEHFECQKCGYYKIYT